MKKATIDIDVCNTIRKSPEAQPATLSTYTALREIATEAGSADFTTTLDAVQRRALIGETSCRRAMRFMERRRLIDRERFGKRIRVRLLRCTKS